MRNISIFLISISSAVLLLLVERLIGIGWDFHPDSVTYVTESSAVTKSIFEDGWSSVANNGYYIISFFLSESILIITSFNLILFSFTNVILANVHWGFKPLNKKSISIVLILLLLNPYRMHLATTMLKDTLIIFLVVISALNFKNFLLLTPFLIALRVASVIYGLIFIPKKYTKFVIIFFVLLLVMFQGYIFDYLALSNDVEMRFRDFDNIPSFQDQGIFGVFVRSIVWPILVSTGSFVLISPSIAYFPVAVGCLFVQLYCYIYIGRWAFTFSIFLPMLIFAALVTGFTSYIRYVYPLMTIIPVVIMCQFKLENSIAASVD